MAIKNQSFKESIKYDTQNQKDIENKFLALLDEYQKQNSFENREYLCYLTSAIYLTYKKLFPQLSIYIPFRTKSDMSFIHNLQKEFKLYFKDVNFNETFDTTSISKDISGIKVILDDINYSRPATRIISTNFR